MTPSKPTKPKTKKSPTKKPNGKGPGGRPTKGNLTAKELKRAEDAAGWGMTLDQIATLLDMSKPTLLKYRALVPALREAIERGRVKAEEQVGKALFKKAIAGDTTAIRYWENTRTKRREHQVVEHQGPEGGPIITASASVAVDLPRLPGESAADYMARLREDTMRMLNERGLADAAAPAPGATPGAPEVDQGEGEGAAEGV